jgi:hypothetical protein
MFPLLNEMRYIDSVFVISLAKLGWCRLTHYKQANAERASNTDRRRLLQTKVQTPAKHPECFVIDIMYHRPAGLILPTDVFCAVCVHVCSTVSVRNFYHLSEMFNFR